MQINETDFEHFLIKFSANPSERNRREQNINALVLLCVSE